MREISERQIRRIENNSPCDTVELNQGQRCGALACRCTEHRSSTARRHGRKPFGQIAQSPVRLRTEENAADKLPAALIAFQSDTALFCGILVQFDELAKGYGKESVFESAKRFNPKHVLKPNHDNREAE
jgi:hypothetical protein